MSEHPLQDEIDNATMSVEGVARFLAHCDAQDIEYTIHDDGSIDVMGEQAFEKQEK